jgi:serine/threonine protein kinase
MRVTRGQRSESVATGPLHAANMAHFHEIMGYEVITTLGYGARSTIFAVQDKKGQIYALKRVVKQSDSDQRYLDQAILEHEVARKFDHPLLRQSFKLIKQRTFLRVSEVLVLMEMVDGVTLEQGLPGDEDMGRLVSVCQQAAVGLGVMHAAGYVHADIKPNNIMVDDRGVAKIIDFGQSCPVGTVKDRIQGTPDYIAPEQVERKTITAATDVFNLGATMYWLITRKHVPTKIPKGEPGMLRTKRECPPPVELNAKCPPALSSLVMQCVQEDPTERPQSMTAVHDRLELAASQINNRTNGVRRPNAERRSAAI